jgi:hypothetical protein
VVTIPTTPDLLPASLSSSPMAVPYLPLPSIFTDDILFSAAASLYLCTILLDAHIHHDRHPVPHHVRPPRLDITGLRPFEPHGAKLTLRSIYRPLLYLFRRSEPRLRLRGPTLFRSVRQSREPEPVTFGHGNGQHTRSRPVHSHRGSATPSFVHLTSSRKTVISTPAPTATDPAALEDEAPSLLGGAIKLAAQAETATSVPAVISAEFAAADALGPVASKYLRLRLRRSGQCNRLGYPGIFVLSSCCIDTH